LDLNSSREIQVGLDVAKIFSAPNKIAIERNKRHDAFAHERHACRQLRQNIEAAFVVKSIREFSPIAELTRGTNHIEIAPNATPYRLTISRFAPQPDLPRDNPLTGEGVALGGRLFFDRRLSADNRLSCAACHRPNDAFSDPRRFSRGVDGDIGTRNAPALENLAWKSSFFWDGRAATLREQVLQPIQNPIEMHDRWRTSSPKFQPTGIITVFLPMPLARRKSPRTKSPARWSNFCSCRFRSIQNSTA
jgi:hypothetical protein